MRFRFLLAALIFAISALQVAAETSHLAFFTEYVRELGVHEHVRELGEKDLTDASPVGTSGHSAVSRSV